MAVSIPTDYPLLRGTDIEVARSLPIRAATVQSLVGAAHYAYAYAGRRTLLQLRRLPITGVTTATLVGKARADFAANRDDRGLRIAYALTNVDLTILIRDATDSTTLATYTDTTGGSVEVETIITGWSTTGSEAVILRVLAERHTTGDASIAYLGAWEGEHSAATLSALAS